MRRHRRTLRAARPRASRRRDQHACRRGASGRATRRFGLRPIARRARAATRSAASDDSILLRALRAEPRDEQQAGRQRADDRADGVGGVDAADEPAGSWPALRPPRAPAGSSRPTGSRAGSTAHSAAHEVELEGDPGIARQRRSIGQYGSDCVQHVRRPRDAPRRAAAAPMPSASARRAMLRAERRADAAADAEADQEHREDQRERVDGARRRAATACASRSLPTPARSSPKGDRDIDRPRRRAARVDGAGFAASAAGSYGAVRDDQERDAATTTLRRRPRTSRTPCRDAQQVEAGQ